MPCTALSFTRVLGFLGKGIPAQGRVWDLLEIPSVTQCNSDGFECPLKAWQGCGCVQVHSGSVSLS